MIAPLLLDPFEQETTLAPESRVLSFGPKAFELSLEALLRHLAFDLVGAIPRALGAVEERLPGDAGDYRFRSEFHQVGAQVLAVATEVEELGASHRVLELLGVDGDVRVRVNMTRFAPAAVGLATSLGSVEQAEARAGRAIGQVRVWGSETSPPLEVRQTLGRQLAAIGVDTRGLDRSVVEPQFRPPAARRIQLDALPPRDLQVAEALLALLAELPAEGAQRRPAKQIAQHTVRVRRRGAIVTFHYETHRAATGALHIRRREVEAGAERPGLVRTFNVAGLRGGARLRIREVGGRVAAEFAGALDAVEAIDVALGRALGARVS